MKIKIVSYNDFPSGKLQGFVDIQIIDWGLTIQGCKLFKNDKGSWLGLPDKEYTNKDGDRKWQSFLTFTADVDKEFQHEAKAAIQKHLEGTDNTPATPPQDDIPPIEQEEIPF